MIASFGSKVFSVSADKIDTFNSFQISSSLDTDKQDNLGKKPSTYIKGPGLSNFSVRTKLDISLGVDPLKSMEEWMSIEESEQPYPFIIGGKPFLNTKWLLVGVDGRNTIFDNQGNMLCIELDLKFDEFSNYGTKPTKSSNTSSSTTSVYEALKPKQKSELKTYSGREYSLIE